MSNIKNREGLSPALRQEIAQRDKALSGDMVLSITPPTLGSSAAAVNTAIAGSGFTRRVTIELLSSDDFTAHDWFDGTFAAAVAEVTAGSGTASIVGSVATFVNGRAAVTITYTGTWSSGDTCTLTITGSTKLGYTIADKTSVDTLIA